MIGLTGRVRRLTFQCESSSVHTTAEVVVVVVLVLVLLGKRKIDRARTVNTGAPGAR